MKAAVVNLQGPRQGAAAWVQLHDFMLSGLLINKRVLQKISDPMCYK
jgi:hypothetical protein